jgi:glycosyltransferase involved in cell wall biosynthesis
MSHEHKLGDVAAARPRVFLMNDALRTGGTERQFSALARSLRPESFQVMLGCMHRVGVFLNGLGDIAEFDVGGSFFTLQAQRSFVALVKYLRSRSVAIAHSFDFYSNLMLIPAARLAGVPVVIGSQRQLGDLLTPAQRAVQSVVFRISDRVVCNSRAAADLLAQRGLPRHKLTVIPNGLSNEAFAEATPALPRIPGLLRVGLIARMNDPVKNQTVLLHAAARLKDKFPHVEYLLVGDGHLRHGLEQIARKLGLADRVRFMGERHDIPAILAAMDISVVASSSESLSNVILESMAAARPVVATRVGGNPELVRDGETGVLVPTNDESKLAEALAQLLARPSLREELGRKAQSVARAQFGMERVRDQYEHLYAALVAEKSGQAPRGQSDSLLAAYNGTASAPERDSTVVANSATARKRCATGG